MQEDSRMKESVMISIVIPCYNDANYIEQSVFSALNQTYSNFEVIVVDDGSNSETKTILKSLEPKITKLITQENLGQSKARNKGIEHAKGDYILVLDSDDFFETTFCEKAIKVMTENPEVKIVSCYTFLLFDDGSNSIFKTVGGSLTNFLCNNSALGSALFKKEDWAKCGGFDETMRQGLEDWEFYIRLLKNGGIAQIIKEPLYNYRKRSNTTTERAQREKYELYRYIYLKHQDLYKANFETFVDYMLYKLNREEREKIKNTLRLEFRIGKAFLRPFRFIKHLFKSI